MNRRRFLHSTLAAGAGFPALLKAAGPNGTLVVGIIGVSRSLLGNPGRGTELALALAALPNVEIACMCDVDGGFLKKAIDTLSQKGQRPRAERDFRKMLEDPRIDAVVIATPDHWHATAAMLALTAGKHVYLEAPCTHRGEEGNALVEVVNETKKLVQHGTQRRSWPAIQEAMEKLKSGAIGRLLCAKTLYFGSRPSIGRGKPAAPPADLDWNMWLGPAPDRPFQENFVPSNWRWIWDWGTGEVGYTGVHLLDICRWGMELGMPARISSGGVKSRYPDEQETPDNHVASFDFAGKSPFTVTWESRSWAPRTPNDPKHEIAFYGEEGSLLITGSAYAMYDPAGKQIGGGAGAGGTENHLRNFVDSIRGNAKLAAPIADGIISANMCHMANISWRTNHTLLFNSQRNRIMNDIDANLLWEKKYRAGWAPKN